MAFFDPRRPVYLENPYPALRELRRSAPVHWSAELHAWVVTPYAECARVLQDTAAFSANVQYATSPLVRDLGQRTAAAPLARVATLSTSDGELHAGLRKLASAGFTVAATNRLDALVGSRAEALAAELPANGEFDLMESFADPLARDVGLLALGVPPDDLDEFWRWVARIEFARSRPTTERTVAASQDALRQLEAYLPGLSASTVLGALWQRAGQASAEIALSVIVQVAAVGSGPTAGAIANAMLALVEHPEQEPASGADLATWSAAADEFLRYDTPAHAVTRFAVEDTELGGRRVRAGSTVYVMIGSANRDESVFCEPERLDLARDARRQLSFGHGAHFCLGAGLARRAIAHALRALRLRMPQVRVAGVERGAAFELRIPERLVIAAG